MIMHASLIPRVFMFVLAFVLPVIAYATHSPTHTIDTTHISQFISLFNIMVGLMFASAVVSFGGGVITYVVYFGNKERSEGVELMKWGVAILFALVVILGFVQFLQGHGGVGNTIVALAVIGIVVVGVIFALTAAPAKEDEKKKKT